MPHADARATALVAACATSDVGTDFEGKVLKVKRMEATKPNETIILSFFLRFDLSIFTERGREREREKEKHRCCLSHAPNQGPARNLGMCPDWESNRRPLASQDDAEPTKPRGSDQNTNSSYQHPY